MANPLRWRAEWTLDIDVLDRDHRRLVDRLGDITERFGPEAADSGGGELIAALDRFGSEAREHFRREEEFMRTIDYPGIAAEHKDHALLMAEFSEVVRHLRNRGAVRLEAADLDALKHWLVAHVLGSDRGFADHYFRLLDRPPNE